MKWFGHILCVFIFLGIQGCAAMMEEPSVSMLINSKPKDALVTIRDEKGVDIFKGHSPLVVELNKSDGSFMGGKTYLVTISKENFKTKIYPVISVPNGYYVFGNVFTIYVGWFIDPFFGNMYDLSPNNINAELEDDE